MAVWGTGPTAASPALSSLLTCQLSVSPSRSLSPRRAPLPSADLRVWPRVLCIDAAPCAVFQDFFFYSLVYDPQQKTLLADKGEIRVGNRYQADITDLLKEGRVGRGAGGEGRGLWVLGWGGKPQDPQQEGSSDPLWHLEILFPSVSCFHNLFEALFLSQKLV